MNAIIFCIPLLVLLHGITASDIQEDYINDFNKVPYPSLAQICNYYCPPYTDLNFLTENVLNINDTTIVGPDDPAWSQILCWSCLLIDLEKSDERIKNHIPTPIKSTCLPTCPHIKLHYDYSPKDYHTRKQNDHFCQVCDHFV